MIRLFVNYSLQESGKVPLTVSQSHYLTHVMRLKEGALITCFNGVDGDWNAQLTRQKKDWFLQVQKKTKPQQKHKKTILCMALIKRDALAYTLQKATELGVSEVYLIKADRSNTEKVNMERLKSIVCEACEQCERNDIPAVHVPTSLNEVLDTLSGKAHLIWLLERGKTKKVLSKLSPAFFIGPEGGWSPKEQALFMDKKACSWHLGDTILRAETAAVAALALWQYKDEIKKLAI